MRIFSKNQENSALIRFKGVELLKIKVTDFYRSHSIITVSENDSQLVYGLLSEFSSDLVKSLHTKIRTCSHRGRYKITTQTKYLHENVDIYLTVWELCLNSPWKPAKCDKFKNLRSTNVNLFYISFQSIETL